MNNNVDLREPDILGDAILAYVSVLLPDDVYNSDWINNYFIDLQFDVVKKEIRFSDYYSKLCNDYIIEKKYDEYPIFEVKQISRGLEDYLKKNLGWKYFIVVNWREDVIINNIMYQDRGLIYDYDDIDGTFKVALCTKDGKWNPKRVNSKDINSFLVAGKIDERKICFFDLLRTGKDVGLRRFSYNDFAMTISGLKDKFENNQNKMWNESIQTYLTLQAWMKILRKRIGFLHDRFDLEDRKLIQMLDDGIHHIQNEHNLNINSLLVLCRNVVDLLYKQLQYENKDELSPVQENHFKFQDVLHRKQLKCLEPPIRTYLGDAFCHSIIGDIAFESGWIYDKYIFLEYTESDGQIKFSDYDYYDFMDREGVFVKSYTSIPFVAYSYDIVISAVLESIDREEYFFSFWDEGVIVSFMNKSINYRYHFHGCFVYGYDGNKKVFLMHGYFDNIWKRIEVPFHIFYNAIDSIVVQRGEFAYCGYSLVKYFDWKPNHERMAERLQGLAKESMIVSNANSKYNIEGCRMFWENIISNLQGGFIHCPSIYCMNEHNSIMQRRIEYMYNHGLITNYLEITEILNQLAKIFAMMTVSSTYYNITKKQSSIIKLRNAAQNQIELQMRVYNLIAESIILNNN